ncbi:hypothetical protein Mpsy_0052 [Methanolobus psychrophilus R15]|nr:hypothetical protein Mpsy_0052 [Methanolobus psychrophilus R15]
MKDLDHMKNLIAETFNGCSSKISFARRWIEKLMENKLENISY